MKGVGIRPVAQLMGHRTIQMTMRYAHSATHHNQDAVEKLVDYKILDWCKSVAECFLGAPKEQSVTKTGQ